MTKINKIWEIQTSNNFDSPYVLEKNVKRYLCDTKKYDNLLFMLISGVWIQTLRRFMIFF